MQIRSFIAIELPAVMKSALTQLQARIKGDRSTPVKWVNAEGIHLTLKFLGNIDPCQVNPILQAIMEAARGIPPIRLEAGGVGAFPDLKRVRVIWAGLGGELDRLMLLQRRIEEKVSPLGFPTEARPFAPHLTLGRVREGASGGERESLGQSVASARFEPGISFCAESVNLMRSQLAREGAIYSQLGMVRLGQTDLPSSPC